MKKLSVLAVVAGILALPNAAQAKVPVLDLGDICHFLAVVVDHSRVSGFSHFTCQTGNFVGVIGKAHGSDGRAFIASLQVLNQPDSQFLLQVDYPLVNGGSWTLYYTKDGYSAKIYQSGTYKVMK
ncbi:MAG: hypothetical protein ACJ8IR_10415 [Alphaproteobacteria bacterium]|jgi:hypothetical protein